MSFSLFSCCFSFLQMQNQCNIFDGGNGNFYRNAYHFTNSSTFTMTPLQLGHSNDYPAASKNYAGNNEVGGGEYDDLLDNNNDESDMSDSSDDHGDLLTPQRTPTTTQPTTTTIPSFFTPKNVGVEADTFTVLQLDEANGRELMRPVSFSTLHDGITWRPGVILFGQTDHDHRAFLHFLGMLLIV